jgi:hypothetical protein
MSKTFSFDELFDKTEKDDEETISRETYYIKGTTLNGENFQLGNVGAKEGESVIVVSDDDDNDEREKILNFNDGRVKVQIRKNLHDNTGNDIVIYIQYSSGSVEKTQASSKTLQLTEIPYRHGGKKKTQKQNGKTKRKTRKYNRNHKRDKSKRINIK